MLAVEVRISSFRYANALSIEGNGSWTLEIRALSIFLVAPNLMAAEIKAANSQKVALRAFSAARGRSKLAYTRGFRWFVAEPRTEKDSVAERSQFELSGDFPVADWDRAGRGDDAKEKGTERQSARSRVTAPDATS